MKINQRHTSLSKHFMSCQDHKLCHALPNQVHTLGHGVSVLNEEIIKIYSKPPFIAR